MTEASMTKRVRLLVAIDDCGHWTCFGGTNISDDEAREWICTDDMNEHMSYHWIEADVPLPASITVEGKCAGARGRSRDEQTQ